MRSPTGPHESVLLDSLGGDRDSAAIRHPVSEPEEAVDAFSHTRGADGVIPHRTPGTAADNLGGGRPHGEPHRGCDQQGLTTPQCTKHVNDIAPERPPHYGGDPIPASGAMHHLP